MNRRKFKDLERQAMVMWGYDPSKKDKADKQGYLAEQWNKDPLFGFPNDTMYFTRKQIEDKMSVSRRFGKRVPEPSRWDRDRGEACLGRFGIVPRRCSMNDKLWGFYQKAKNKGVTLTLDDIKKMIVIDIKRSKLYPPGWTDDSVNPPQWYVDELQKKGLLDGIFNEIDGAMRS